MSESSADWGKHVHVGESAGWAGSPQTCPAITSTTAVKLQTLKKSAWMISFKSGASRGLWCSSCCAEWGAHGRLISKTIKVLWSWEALPAQSSLLLCLSLKHFMRASPSRQPMSGVTALSTMPPSTSNPSQQDISSLSLLLSHSLFSLLWQREEGGGYLASGWGWWGAPGLWSVIWAPADMPLWFTVDEDPLWVVWPFEFSTSKPPNLVLTNRASFTCC